MSRVVISVDFDLTVCESEYPACGPRIEGARKYVNKLYKEGYGIVINTCRTNRAAAIALDWLDENKIKYHYFNCNFPHRIKAFGEDCRKISAEIYVDDKQVGGLPKWEEIYKYIKEKYPDPHKKD